VKPLARLLAVLALLASAASAASAAEGPSSAVPFETALADARRLADAKPGLSLVRVAGTSMLPYFGDGAVLVLRPASAAKLQAGMIVVYTNRDGEMVAHRLIAADGAGWIAQGYNNGRPDSTRVTDANLLGVVYATFHSSGHGNTADLAASLRTPSIPLALAAPAK
jgi:signal peptidase I